jgi:hypothetical protein
LWRSLARGAPQRGLFFKRLARRTERREILKGELSMATARVRWVRPACYILGAFAWLTLAGCGSSFKLISVSGTVYGADDKPLKGGGLNFVPDTTKGNNTPVQVVGRIDSSGHYEMSSFGVQGKDAGKGVPPGWYKVTIQTELPGDKGEVPIRVNPKYYEPGSTPLTMEVVDHAEPGHYDIHLKLK